MLINLDMDNLINNNKNWHRLNGKPLKLTLKETLLNDISNSTSNLKFYIGSDSHCYDNKIVYSIVLVMLKKGCGGIGYYKRVNEDYKLTTQQRLFQETYYAVELATYISPILESIGYKIEEIHTDLNPNPKYVSHSMINQCLGYIKGMGFIGKTKPNSWAASSVADLKSR